MPVTTIAAVALAVLGALAILQLLLAAGAPLGRFAWGGQHAVLPPNLRRSSLVTIGLYGLFSWIILERAGMLATTPVFPNWAIWALTAYFALGTAMNAMSRSKPERNLMTPLALLLTVCCLLLAL